MAKQKKRILLLVPLPPPVHGSSLVSQMIQESSIINHHYKTDYINISTSRKINEIGKFGIVSLVRKTYYLCYALLKTLTKLLFNRYDLCYLAITCHGLGFIKDSIFVFLCKLFRRSIIIHQHNKGMKNDMNKPIYKWLIPAIYKEVKVILLSKKLYPDIAEIVKESDVIVCPNGITETRNDNEIIERNHTCPTILFLSNLLPEKGVYTLLDSLQIIHNIGYDFQCYFAGNESKDISRMKIELEINNRDLSNNVKYLGPKYGDEKALLFKESDIFTFPSNYVNEAFSLVLLEAMQYSLPIITTGIGGLTDIVEDKKNGFIVNTNDPIQLSDAIIKLINNPELRIKMGNEGYIKFKNHFTIKKFEERIDEIFDQF